MHRAAGTQGARKEEKMKHNLVRLGTQFFAEEEAGASLPTPPEVTPQLPVQATLQAETDYTQLLKTDKKFQSFVDSYTAKSNQTAVQNAILKQQRLTDEKLSESDRLQAMSADEKAKYYENKYNQAEQMRTRDKEVDSLKAQTKSMLTEGNIPDVFLSVFDFENATAEDIKQRVSMLAEYEYYPKGELEKRIQIRLQDKLKQKPLEVHGGQPNVEDDPFLKGFNRV